MAITSGSLPQCVRLRLGKQPLMPISSMRLSQSYQERPMDLEEVADR